MVNRVFSPETAIDVAAETGEKAGSASVRGPGETNRSHDHEAIGLERRDPEPAAAPPAPASDDQAGPPLRRREWMAAAAASGEGRRDQPLLLLAVLGGVGLISAIGSAFYLNHWNQMQSNISQERNLLLVERLRNLGPASPQPPAAVEAPTLPQPPGGAPPLPQTSTTVSDAPPPPPEEPWIEDLERLPGGQPTGTASTPLRVPLRSTPSRSAPAPAAAPRLSRTTPLPPTPVPLPQLVGVVGAPGRAGSAIFQTGGGSTSVSVGEMIAGTPWRLRAADGDTVLLERPGELRRLSIGNGY